MDLLLIKSVDKFFEGALLRPLRRSISDEGVFQFNILCSRT